MYKIVKKEVLAPAINLLEIEAPMVARKAEAGQFIILRSHEYGERLPLAIADFNRDKGTVTCVFEEVGKTTIELGTFKEGECVKDFVGPLGETFPVENYGKVVCVGCGVGAAQVYPIASTLKDAGNEVIGIMGARNKESFFWEEKMRAVCTELMMITDDGLYMRKVLVTDVLKEIIEKEGNIAFCIAIGPQPMMRAVCDLTKEYDLKTVVSLNSTMVDGIGLCGCCRVTVGGVTRFTCLDGPVFDGHQVDFNELAYRSAIYKPQEQFASEKYGEKGSQKHSCACRAGK